MIGEECRRSHRRCDRLLPSCKQCIERNRVCVYQSRKKYTRKNPPSPSKIKKSKKKETMEKVIQAVAAMQKLSEMTKNEQDKKCNERSHNEEKGAFLIRNIFKDVAQ